MAMTAAVSSSHPDLVRLSSELVAAYVCHNAVPFGTLPTLIASVHTALGALIDTASAPVAAMETPKPSQAEIKCSVTPDALVSFLDGGRYKMLKRHLGHHGLTPAEYRARFGLPGDYPMVAPAYAAERSALAKSIGLGSLRKRHPPASA